MGRLASLFLTLLLPTLAANGATRIWDGSAGTNWSTAANWSNSVAPGPGDILVFPAGAANRTNFNNYANGTGFDSIEVSDNYTLTGNRITLANGIKINASGALSRRVTVRNDITLGAEQTFDVDGSGRSAGLVIQGNVNLNGHSIHPAGDGVLEFAGTVGNAGDFGGISRYGSGSGNIVLSGTNSGPASDVIIYAESGTIRADGIWTNAFVNVSGLSTLVGTGRVDTVVCGPFRPGNNGPGRFTVGTFQTGGNLSQGVGSMEVDLRGPNPGVDYDQLVVLDRLSLAGFTPPVLYPLLSYTPELGESFTVVDFRGTNAFSSFRFPGNVFSRNPIFSTNGYSLQMFKNGGDGNDIVLTTVRTPTSKVSIWNEFSAQFPDQRPDKRWMAANNWETVTAPQAGDRLIFRGENDLNDPFFTTNNYPAGTAFGPISMESSNWRFYGNGISLIGNMTNGGYVGNGYDTIWNIPLTLSSNAILHVSDTATNKQYSSLGPLGDAADLSINASITGSGGIIKEGAGTLSLGTSNTYSGTTVVNAGTIRTAEFLSGGSYAIPGPLVIGNGTNPAAVILLLRGIHPAAPITIREGGLLYSDMNGMLGPITFEGGMIGMYPGREIELGGNVVVASASSQARITNGNLYLNEQTVGITVADNPPEHDFVIAARLQGGTVAKFGAGTLAVSGLGSAGVHSTPMMIHAGRLVMNDHQTALVTLLNGTLAGNGVIGSLVANGGVVAPGDNVGRLRVRSSVTLSPSARLALNLNGVTAGVTYDQLSVTGAVNLASATLDLAIGFAPTIGNSFVILANEGFSAIQGTFAGLPEGAVFNVDGYAFQITYTGGNGNDVALTRINTPATISAPRTTPGGLFQFQGRGDVGLSYVVQASTNLTTSNWVNVGTSPADASGLFQFIDTNAPLHPMRFYRAIAP